MAKKTEVYVCDLCGNIVEVLEGADGTLICCGQDMTLQAENTTDAAKEKHVPSVTIDGTTATVCVGSIAHPMEPNHYIAWIELQQGNRFQRVTLKAGDEPKAVFTVEAGVPAAVRAYCNTHGLWKA
ncbi:MAG: desulfoferrodoxin [Planctomycetaceae bacterium]|jgi:superoxide reductase|nr:desulfoferrodoxin [Planctomycetaceae bacterium]